MEKVFILTETFEGDNMIREFQILGVYAEISKAQKAMNDLIEEDEYGIIESNGINERTDNYFETNFIDNFIGYSISENRIIKGNS